MTDISKLNKLELKELLKKLNLLNSLKKSLWNRWFREYRKINDWVNSYRIEYFENSSKTGLDFAREKALISFKELFHLDLKLEEIEFIQNNNLSWWIRIFYNDNMFDLSYARFEKLLK